MAGNLQLAMVELCEIQDNNSLMAAVHHQCQWRALYSRCFTYPSSFLSSFTNHNNNHISILSKKFRPIWLSSDDSFVVDLQLCDHTPQLSILTVVFRDTVIEEHYVARLHFAWPQVSCISGFPARGSLAVIASYIDGEDESCLTRFDRQQKQKFALQFSTPSDVKNFMTSMEDLLSNNLPKQPLSTDVSPISCQSEFIPEYMPDTSNKPSKHPFASDLSPISCQSESIPVYRPDTTSMISPVYTPLEPISSLYETQYESQYQTQDLIGDSESKGVEIPPRFTSLLSICAAEPEQNVDRLSLPLVPEIQEMDLRSYFAKYMQDASFADIVSKVNEVIEELGGDFVI